MKLDRRKVLIICLGFIIYLVVVRIIRPYFYQFSELEEINFILGILPNFIGSLILFLTLVSIPNFSKWVAVLFVLSVVIFMEFNRFYVDNISFDMYDIVASIFGLVIGGLMADKRYKT